MSQVSRRTVLGATAGTLAGLAVAGSSALGAGLARATSSDSHRPPSTGLRPFDEVYRGRRIKGTPTTDDGGHHDPHAGHEGHSGHGGHAGHGGQAHDFGYRVTVDGEELHVMRNADGTWISVVNHYETYPEPRALARAAVVELQGAALVPLALA
ncbi:tyrosinase cofactor [Streptomyces durbertensis]|uniref:Tyrosinase cofactor n=1 Tax=Streptomyces durbertensis TaxID=2448886 RepID=A0ABR6ED88_9ACTN|nr:tyrosinase cofactor [Streptomyces durbertensis]MBB1243292.1 tyrosinase cofactor [Streptomyces durbertensis]